MSLVGSTPNTTRPFDAAHALAQRALTLSNPNPRVGCILVAPDGRTIGEGHTQAAGGPHAEVMALRDAAARGESTHGATAYVTLEPCSHHGRTPPCSDALIGAGLARVVVATPDPNPMVAGRGLARMQAAGIEVSLLPTQDPHAHAARELNIGFFSRMMRGTPWVRMKVAASLDGSTALGNGASQWITGETARADGHAWRARACAVLTGIGTVLEDNPMLDVRQVPATRQPHLVLIDSQLATPLDARLWGAPAHGLHRSIWIYGADAPDGQHALMARRAALQARGAEVVCLPGAGGKVDLPAVLRDLARREVNELHVEAGHKLNASFWREGLVDELLLYQAPRLLGSGTQGMASFGPLQALSEAPELAFESVERVGNDLRLLARARGRADFLHCAHTPPA